MNVSTPHNGEQLIPPADEFDGKKAYAYMRGGAHLSRDAVDEWCYRIRDLFRLEGYRLHSVFRDAHAKPVEVRYRGFFTALEYAQQPDTFGIAVMDLDCPWMPTPELIATLNAFAKVPRQLHIMPVLERIDPYTVLNAYEE